MRRYSIWLSFCSNCGAKLNEEQAVCLECGVLINNTNITNNNVNSNVNKSDKSSLVGFILGLVSIAAWIIPLFGYPVTICGIIFSAKGLKSINGKGKAIAGLILSITFLIASFYQLNNWCYNKFRSIIFLKNAQSLCKMALKIYKNAQKFKKNVHFLLFFIDIYKLFIKNMSKIVKMHKNLSILCIFLYFLIFYDIIFAEVMKMEPIRVKELPIEYSIDKDLLRLISEANAKYGEYKACLKNMDFDSKFFLDSIILTESFKSTQIEGTQISQDDMYYLKYMPQTDDNKEIQNLKSVINYSKEYLKRIKKLI